MSNPLMNELPYRIEKSDAMIPFWEGLSHNQLKTTKCIKCSTLHYPPSPILCTKCFSSDIEWHALPLSGKISTWTHVTAPAPGFNHDYILASVIIDELNKAVLGRYRGKDLEIGMTVKIDFEKIGEETVFIFKNV